MSTWESSASLNRHQYRDLVAELTPSAHTGSLQHEDSYGGGGGGGITVAAGRAPAAGRTTVPGTIRVISGIPVAAANSTGDPVACHPIQRNTLQMCSTTYLDHLILCWSASSRPVQDAQVCTLANASWCSVTRQPGSKRKYNAGFAIAAHLQLASVGHPHTSRICKPASNCILAAQYFIDSNVIVQNAKRNKARRLHLLRIIDAIRATSLAPAVHTVH